jgi:hypothetical protein
MSDDRKKPLTADEVLRKLDRDVVGMPEDLVDEALAKRGLDPAKVAAKGRAVLQGLARAHRYESMQRKAADKKRRDQEAKDSVSPAERREGIARVVRRIKAGDQGLHALFRDRSPDQMNEAELESIAEDFFWAERLPKGDGDGQG